MRARRRRSVLNTVSAAALEVAIMGIFVIIAQPQLRDALFEILQVDPAHTASSATAGRAVPTSQNGPATTTAALEQTVQAVLHSPVGHAVESSLAQWANGQRPDAPSLLVSTPSTQASVQQSSPAQPGNVQPGQLQFFNSPPAQLPSTSSPSTSAMSANTTWRDQPAQNQVAGYSPFDQYESLRVSVPNQSPYQPQVTASQNGGAQANGALAYNAQGYAVPQYQAPTQLSANQWNVASAAQSPRPHAQAHTNQWIPNQVTETSFRQVYPPPYGTQSMWK